MFPTLLPALRIDFASFFDGYSLTEEEARYRAEALTDSLIKGGVKLAGVSLENPRYCWLVFHTAEERKDVQAAMQRVLAELKQYRKWEKGQSGYTTPQE